MRTNAPIDQLSEVAPPADGYERIGTLGTVNDARDIADAVLFLASDEARHVSGQLLTVASGANSRL